MPDEMDILILSIFKQMIHYSQEIFLLLKKDVDFFDKNQFSALADSNQKKTELTAKLSALAEKLMSTCPNGLGNYIEHSSAKNEINVLADQLNNLVKDCNKYISANSDLVFVNLQILKDVWDKLSAKSQNNIYDEAGKIIGCPTP